MSHVFEGKQGLKSVFEDTLRERKEIFVFGGGGKFKDALGPYSELWHKQRGKARITLRLLWNESLREKKIEVMKYHFAELRFLPKVFDNPAQR